MPHLNGKRKNPWTWKLDNWGYSIWGTEKMKKSKASKGSMGYQQAYQYTCYWNPRRERERKGKTKQNKKLKNYGWIISRFDEICESTYEKKSINFK